MLWGEKSGIGGDGYATVQGNKNVFMKDIREYVITVVYGVVESYGISLNFLLMFSFGL